MLRPALNGLKTSSSRSSTYVLNSISGSISSPSSSASCSFCSSTCANQQDQPRPQSRNQRSPNSNTLSSNRFGSLGTFETSRNGLGSASRSGGGGQGQQSNRYGNGDGQSRYGRDNNNNNAGFQNRTNRDQKSYGNVRGGGNGYNSSRNMNSDRDVGNGSQNPRFGQRRPADPNHDSNNGFPGRDTSRFQRSTPKNRSHETFSDPAEQDTSQDSSTALEETSMDSLQDDSEIEDNPRLAKKKINPNRNPSSSSSRGKGRERAATSTSTDKDRPPNRFKYSEESSKRDGHRGAVGGNRLIQKKQEKPKSKVKVLQEPKVKKQVFLPNFITTNNLARLLGIKMKTLQTKMTEIGLNDNRPDLLLSFSDSELLASEYNLTASVDEEASFDIYPRPEPSSSEEASSRPLRPPVVTIMGHVDHGKTTLLDKLRSTSIAVGEAGGITQHIGAFSVPVGSAAKLSAEISGKTASAEGGSGSKIREDQVQTITFLDTPGHAAFAAMRSRGASVTDIVVLVCAADDGVMPQTKEVINLVKELNEEVESKSTSDPTSGKKQSGGVQLVVALSKIDKPDSEPDRVKRELLAAGIELEEFGGEIPCVGVSGKTGEGLVELEETIAAISELADLRSEKDGLVEGYVLESRIEKGRGNIATILVKRGQLKVGDCIVAGTSWAKVRAIIDINNKQLKAAFPCDPVLVTGWKDLPNAGDELLGAVDETQAKKAVENRKRNEERKKLLKDVESINEGRRLKAEEDERKELEEFKERQRRRALRQASNDGTVARDPVTGAPVLSDEEIELESKQQEEAESTKKEMLEYKVIIKADFSGTAEAVIGAIENIGNQEAKVTIVSSGVGDVSEGDIAMAQAIGGHIIGFNVKAPRSIQQQASRLQPPVEIHCDDVIYRLMSYTTEKVAGLLPPKIEKRVTGEASIAQIFPINVKSRIFKNIAGCKITNGIIARNSMVRVLRSGEEIKEGEEVAGGRKVVFEGALDTLKHLKKDVSEMRKGTECGMAFEGFEDFKVEDVVQCFNIVEVPRTL